MRDCDGTRLPENANELTEKVYNTCFIVRGEGMKNIYALNSADVLDITFFDRFFRKVNVSEVNLATNQYGKGRGVYIAGLPYSSQNASLLYRALFWACGKESEMKKAYSSNPLTEYSYYPESKKYAMINNVMTEQNTVFFTTLTVLQKK